MAKVLKSSGTEGSTYDPYFYEEWTVTKNGKTMTLHTGLGVWLNVEGNKAPFADEKTLVERFERFIGCSLDALEKAYRANRHRCKTCGCRRTRQESGFPGESLNVCVRCDDIVSSDFHLSEIE